jgi:hypothetical protein
MAFDGVIQAPAADEDRSGGFQHGGWHLQYFDEPSMNWVVSNLNAAAGSCSVAALRGLRPHWPKASEEEQPVAEPPK